MTRSMSLPLSLWLIRKDAINSFIVLPGYRLSTAYTVPNVIDLFDGYVLFSRIQPAPSLSTGRDTNADIWP